MQSSAARYLGCIMGRVLKCVQQRREHGLQAWMTISSRIDSSARPYEKFYDRRDLKAIAQHAVSPFIDRGDLREVLSVDIVCRHLQPAWGLGTFIACKALTAELRLLRGDGRRMDQDWQAWEEDEATSCMPHFVHQQTCLTAPCFGGQSHRAPSRPGPVCACVMQ